MSTTIITWLHSQRDTLASSPGTDSSPVTALLPQQPKRQMCSPPLKVRLRFESNLKPRSPACPQRGQLTGRWSNSFLTRRDDVGAARRPHY
ncbi:hypothetical protein MHYP_G00321380 [Metynnis hypsauchen]